MSNLIDSVNRLANTVAYNNALNTETNLSVDFINKFGSYSNNFSQITQIGGEKHFWYYIVTGISIFLSVIFYFISKEEDKEDKPENKKPLSKKPGTIAFYILIAIMIGFISYSIYRYFFVYKPEYNQWFSSLPNDARNLLASINTVRQAMNIINDSYSNTSSNPSMRYSR
jgi:hypothetical protein